MRVVLATDGSADAKAAGAWLAELPLPEATEVLVVTVASIPTSTLDIAPVREVQQAMRDEAAALAETQRAPLARRWPRAALRVAEGDPRDEIPRVAADWRADLVVLGARGLGAVGRFLLGSVSLGVARHAPCPVVVVRGGARPLRTALVAVDGSDHSLAAARFLCTLSLDGVGVRLLAVIAPPRFPIMAPAVAHASLRAAIDRAVEERRAALRTALDRVAAELKAASVTEEIAMGNPGEEILRAAGADVDLVVLGARGLGGRGRLLLGSVSEAVLHHAPCPVLIVKPAPGGAS